MKSIRESMRDLIKILNNATNEYNKGTPIMSDEDWDKLYFQLKDLEEKTKIIYPDSPTQTIYYEIIDNLNKVKHNHPMLSCDKTKSEDEIKKFIKQYDCVGMLKLDGLTCSLHYIGGKLVGAETRGNGYEGNDILHIAKVINNIPQTIKNEDEIIIDGEIIIKLDDFEKFKNEYKNPRNLAAGSLSLLDTSEAANRNLSFVAWNWVNGTLNSFHLNLLELEKLGFEIVQWWFADQIELYIDVHKENAKNYPIDGLVYRIIDTNAAEDLGATAHHRKDMLALKFYDETYTTHLRNIEWTMGRSGSLCPVAIFDEVEIDGTNVSRASLHNLNILEQILGMPFYGQEIEVMKCNMIIPQIASAKKENDDFSLVFLPPIGCPYCGEMTKRIDDVLYCSNPYCNTKLVNRIDHFCSIKGLNIKGMSTATIEKLIELKWVNKISDIFELKNHRNEWIILERFGAKSVDNILAAIEKSKNCTLESFISALGISLIGANVAKELCKHIDSWEDFRNKINNKYDFSLLDGFGESKCDSLLNYNYTDADIIYKYLNIQKEERQTSNNFNGLNIVITGKLSKPRATIQKIIEAAGGKVASSVSGRTNVLIANEEENTAKYNKAVELKIPILTEDEFFKKFDI